MPAPRARSVSHVLPTQLPCRSAGSIRSLSVRDVNDACILRAQADVEQIHLVTKRSTTSKTCFFGCVRLVNKERSFHSVPADAEPKSRLAQRVHKVSLVGFVWLAGIGACFHFAPAVVERRGQAQKKTKVPRTEQASLDLCSLQHDGQLSTMR
jgi:hypothetical protein